MCSKDSHKQRRSFTTIHNILHWFTELQNCFRHDSYSFKASFRQFRTGPNQLPQVSEQVLRGSSDVLCSFIQFRLSFIKVSENVQELFRLFLDEFLKLFIMFRIIPKQKYRFIKFKKNPAVSASCRKFQKKTRAVSATIRKVWKTKHAVSATFRNKRSQFQQVSESFRTKREQFQQLSENFGKRRTQFQQLS